MVKEGQVIHTERIDRLAALLVRYMSRFQGGAPVPVVDRRRVERLRLAIALELAEVRVLRLTPRPARVLRWLVPLNLHFRLRRRDDSPA
jgi:hypothetical protein